MATHFSILAWKIPWIEEPGGLQSMGCKELDTTEKLSQDNEDLLSLYYGPLPSFPLSPTLYYVDSSPFCYFILTLYHPF